MIRRILLSTKYLFYIAIICMLLLTLLLFFYGALYTADMLATYLNPVTIDPESFKKVMVAAIEDIDTFLLATVTYITAMGIYTLFLDKELPLPSWLKITSLYDLKIKLISVLIVVVSVFYVGVVLNWKGEGWGPLILGGGIGIFIAALTFYIWKGTGD